MKKIIIIPALLVLVLVPMNSQTKIIENSVPNAYKSITMAFPHHLDNKIITETIPELRKKNKQIQIVKEIPKKHKQEIVKIEKEISPQIVIENKQIVIVDRIEGDIAVIEFMDRTTIDIALSDLPRGITRSNALILDNGIYTVSVEETNKRKAIIEELTKDMFI